VRDGSVSNAPSKFAEHRQAIQGEHTRTNQPVTRASGSSAACARVRQPPVLPKRRERRAEGVPLHSSTPEQGAS
jgi:hypothetical protein